MGLAWAPPPRSHAESTTNGTRVNRGSDGPKPVTLAALILSGRSAQAIPALRKSIETRSAAASLVDLSAALYEDARAAGDGQELVEALAATDRALQESPRLPEALFNRVLVLDDLGLNKPATLAALKYLTIDGASPWASEIRERLPRLEKTSEASWPAEHTRLENAVQRGDTKEIERVVHRFPTHARVFAEKDCLGTWGSLAVRNDPQAVRQLDVARAVGTALKHLHGESLVFDAVNGIDQTIDQGERLRLAGAFASLAHAQALNAANHIDEAVNSFEQARNGLQSLHNPMAAVAAHNEATALFNANRLQDSAARLDNAWAATPERYHALRGQVKWMRGLLLGVGGRLYESLKEFREAGEEFRVIDEQWFVRRMDNFVADLLARLGDSRGAYLYHRATFASASEAGDDGAIHGFVHTAALHEMMEERWSTAIALLDLICDDATMETRLRADSLIQRALAHVRNYQPAEARRDLAECRRLTATLPDQELIARTLADADFVEAAAVEAADPKLGVAMASRSIEFATAHRRTFRLPELYLEHARCSIATGEETAAMADLDRSLALYEQRRREVKAETLRDSFSGTAQPVFDVYLQLLARRKDNDRLFEVAERSRARLLLDRFSSGGPRSAIPTVAQLRHSMPRQTVLVEYVTLPGSTVILAIGNDMFHAASIDVSADAVSTLVTRLRQAIAAEQNRDALRASRELYKVLIAPVAADLEGASILVVCPDPLLESVPFAALADDSTGRYLVENLAIVVAPSASAFASALSIRRPDTQNMLVVGDPAFNSDLFPGLPRLYGAGREAREIAGLYQNSSLLTGSSASASAVLGDIGSRSFIHLATHAMVNERDPATSCILLAGDHDSSGVLYARDIAKLHLQARLVTLAGCRTAEMASGRGSMRSLAMAFLIAGSSSVVATLWDLDDLTAQQTMISFYRALQSGLTSAFALRDAQIAAIRSCSPRLSTIKSWAAVQLYGVGL